MSKFLSQFYFRVLNIKLNLVKLTFWTAISSHQVMGMSFTKVWVMKYTTLNMVIVKVIQCFLLNFYFSHGCVHMGQMDFISSIFVRLFFFKIIWEVLH